MENKNAYKKNQSKKKFELQTFKVHEKNSSLSIASFTN
jgi:hypothetical protein